MANIKKYNRSALGNMFKHYDRSAKCERDNINPALTHLNYNLATHQPLPQMEFLNKRLSEVKVQNRKDVNLICTCVLTVPKTLNPKEYDKFFKAGYKSLERRYGRANVVSAYVHKDEPNAKPHMHFAFVPVTHDVKKGIDKVSAKEVVCRRDLQTLHKDLQRDIELALGHSVDILNGATKNGNKTIKQLKEQSRLNEALSDKSASYLLKENQRLNKKIARLESKIAELEQADKDFDFFLDK